MHQDDMLSASSLTPQHNNDSVENFSPDYDFYTIDPTCFIYRQKNHGQLPHVPDLKEYALEIVPALHEFYAFANNMQYSVNFLSLEEADSFQNYLHTFIVSLENSPLYKKSQHLPHVTGFLNSTLQDAYMLRSDINKRYQAVTFTKADH